MNLRILRHAIGRSRRPGRRRHYPGVTAECSAELALIADRRRSELTTF